MKIKNVVLVIAISFLTLIPSAKAKDLTVKYQVYEKDEVICRTDSLNITHTCRDDSYEDRYIVATTDDSETKKTIELKAKDGSIKTFEKENLALARLNKSDVEYILAQDEEKYVTGYVYYKRLQDALTAADDYDHVIALEQVAGNVTIKEKVTLDVSPSGWYFGNVINNGAIVLNDYDMMVGSLDGKGTIIFINDKKSLGNPYVDISGDIKTTDITFKFYDVDLEGYEAFSVYPKVVANEAEKEAYIKDVNNKIKQMIEKSIPGYTTYFTAHTDETASAWGDIKIIAKKVEEEPETIEPTDEPTTTQTNVKNPSTGDNIPLMICLSFAGAIVFIVSIKKSLRKN